MEAASAATCGLCGAPETTLSRENWQNGSFRRKPHVSAIIFRKFAVVYRFFLVCSSLQWGPLPHFLKPWHKKTRISTNILEPCTQPSCVSRVFLPALFRLMGLYILYWLDFSHFSIFRRNHTRKNTMEGQSGKTGRSQMVSVVIDSLQCHDNS